MKYLPQALIVENLISVIDSVLLEMKSDESRNKVISALLPFQSVVTLSGIDAQEVLEIAEAKNISLSKAEAKEILKQVALDIETFNLNKVIEESINHYLS
jgi:preprotein translocase subunit YajC